MKDSLIRDNKNYGSVGEFLKEVVKEGSELSVVSAYFTIFAYYGLHEQLDSIKSMKFLFGEPTFITNDNVDVRNYKIEISINDEIHKKIDAIVYKYLDFSTDEQKYIENQLVEAVKRRTEKKVRQVENVDIIDLLSLSTLRFYSGRYHFRVGEIEDGYICFRFK